jgi:hypothetical protein
MTRLSQKLLDSFKKTFFALWWIHAVAFAQFTQELFFSFTELFRNINIDTDQLIAGAGRVQMGGFLFRASATTCRFVCPVEW